MEENMIQKATNSRALSAKNDTEDKALKTMQKYVNTMAPAIKAALPSVLTPERFTRITLTALSTNPKLATCTPASFLGAMMQSAQLGLEVNSPLGQAYLIPYGNQCQFQIGYKGLLDLAYRSGEISSIQAHPVYDGDEFEYELGLEPKLKHKPALCDRGNLVMVYAVIKLKNGGFNFEVMSVDDCNKHRKKYSKANRSPWDTDFEAMCLKTVLKRALKYCPLKSDFIRAVSSDETIKTEITDDMVSVPDATDYEAEYTEVQSNG